MPNQTYVRHFAELGLDDVPEVGGKTASLGELYSVLGPHGIHVPDGFALTARRIAKRSMLPVRGLNCAG